MKIPKIAICVLVVCCGSSAIAGQRIATPARTQSQGPRRIASLSLQERTQLPANTQVKLPSGEVVTLGALREQHESHMRALAAAVGLGRTMGEKLGRQSPVPSQGAGNLSSSPITSGASKAGTTRASPPPPHPVPVTQVASLSMVPGGKLSGFPKDYLDFCNAARSTVCLYLPADTVFDRVLSSAGRAYFEARDYLLSRAVCQYDGGFFMDIDDGYCNFYYPGQEKEDFLPTGPATVTDSCSSSTYTYRFDPKGAVEATANKVDFRTPPGQPQTCVVRVWLSKSN